jgi:hypothetical protein
MSYSFFKKLEKFDDKLIKTNMTINGVGEGEAIGAMGVASMEFTMGSKTIATAFFVTEVKGKYSVILGHDRFM